LNSQTVQLCGDPNIDRLFAMVLALGAELTAVSEELDTLKRVITEQKLLAPDSLKRYRPSPEAQAERDAARSAFVATLMAPFEHAIGAPGEARAGAR
jgi:hypothetical protein